MTDADREALIASLKRAFLQAHTDREAWQAVADVVVERLDTEWKRGAHDATERIAETMAPDPPTPEPDARAAFEALVGVAEVAAYGDGITANTLVGITPPIEEQRADARKAIMDAWDRLTAERDEWKQRASDFSVDRDAQRVRADVNDKACRMAEAELAKVREALAKCRDLFSHIRGDFTDPRHWCREGWAVIDEALRTPSAL